MPAARDVSLHALRLALLLAALAPGAQAQGYGRPEDPAWLTVSWDSGVHAYDGCDGDPDGCQGYGPYYPPVDRVGRSPPGFQGCPTDNLVLEASQSFEDAEVDFTSIGIRPQGCDTSGDLYACTPAGAPKPRPGLFDIGSCAVDPMRTALSALGDMGGFQGGFDTPVLFADFDGPTASIVLLYCGLGQFMAPPDVPRLTCVGAAPVGEGPFDGDWEIDVGGAPLAFQVQGSDLVLDGGIRIEEAVASDGSIAAVFDGGCPAGGRVRVTGSLAAPGTGRGAWACLDSEGSGQWDLGAAAEPTDAEDLPDDGADVTGTGGGGSKGSPGAGGLALLAATLGLAWVVRRE